MFVGGIPGDAGGGLNSQWPATAGSAYQGGDGSEFGGGGGGGIFGGGGGGTAPGIGGGGTCIYGISCSRFIKVFV